MSNEDTDAEDLSAWLELTRQAVSSLEPKVNNIQGLLLEL
jgi:hypothetical protein